jgi:hypothetical protein
VRKSSLLLITLSAFAICIFSSAGRALYGQEGEYMIFVDAETGATDMRGRYARELAPESARLYYEI